MDSTWEKRLVKRYYDKLFKELKRFMVSPQCLMNLCFLSA
uniref:Uncharacterized protein n=1 Tax=Aegilops tauschii subsp. strangulata TaxID=200361 RepID=A0A453QCK4_AEGTS